MTHGPIFASLNVHLMVIAMPHTFVSHLFCVRILEKKVILPVLSKKKGKKKRKKGKKNESSIKVSGEFLITLSSLNNNNNNKKKRNMAEQEVVDLVDNVNAALKGLQGAQAADDAASYRRNLLAEAKKLVASLQDPSTEVWPRAYQVNVGSAIDVAWNMGIWARFRDQETILLSEIVQLTDADEIMISKFFESIPSHHHPRPCIGCE